MKLIAALLLSLAASESHLASKKANEVLKNLFNITYREKNGGVVFSNGYGDIRIDRDFYWIPGLSAALPQIPAEFLRGILKAEKPRGGTPARLFLRGFWGGFWFFFLSRNILRGFLRGFYQICIWPNLCQWP